MNAQLDLAHVFDPLLARNGRPLPPVPASLAPFLRRHVAECLALKRYFFLRLAHLADAVGRIPEPIADVLAVGVGMAYQEEFLAARLPDLRVLATDATRTSGAFPIPNLRFGHLDLMDPPGDDQYDLVFSIECLEHIEDYRRAFRHKAARVRPGGFLYISVPFASRAQQQDPELRRTVWREAEHYTPGFTFDDLDQLFSENGLEVVHASNMFHLDVVLPLRRMIDRLSAETIEERALALAQLLLVDVEDRRAPDSLHSEGIRFLGRKRPATFAAPRRMPAVSGGGLNSQTLADLSAGTYAFLDGGCGTGGSIDHCERRFRRRPGLGLDEDSKDLRTAADRGYRVAKCDLRHFEAPPECVEFASLMDVLEHLPDVDAAERVIAQFGRAARDFLFIRHPSFEDMDLLAAQGLKIGWTDWTKHPNRMRLADFRRIFGELGWHDVVIRPTMPMSDSAHPAIVPLSAPADAEEYVAALHGPKPQVMFDAPVYGKFDIFVRLNPRLSDADWARITSLDGWKGTWAPPGDRKISDDMAARRLNGRLPPPTEQDARAILDAILWRRVGHAVPLTPGQCETVLTALRPCVVERDHGVLHLIHLLDAFNQATDVRRVLVAGTGGGAHAALLAARCPDVVVDREPATADGDGYGFVFSLERHGHPRMDADRLHMLISHVRKGGWLYLALPADATAAVPVIDACLREAEYETLACASIFAADISGALETLVRISDGHVTDASVVDLLRLAVLDFDPPRRRFGARGASGVKYLLRRRS